MLNQTMLNVLLTNDDGIEADGLQTLRRALAALDGVRLVVIAPDGNRSAMARSITTRRPLWVEEVPFSDGSVGYATDGTPVDCVRLASLGLVDGFATDLVVSGINHGANLGDDITYSGTVAAALEGVVLGLPAIAVSQQSGAGDTRLPLRRRLRLRGRGGVRRAHGRAHRGRAAAAADAAERQRARRRAGGRGGDEPRQAHLPRRVEARARGGAPPPLLDLRRRTPDSTTSRGPTWRRSRPAGSR